MNTPQCWDTIKRARDGNIWADQACRSRHHCLCIPIARRKLKYGLQAGEFDYESLGYAAHMIECWMKIAPLEPTWSLSRNVAALTKHIKLICLFGQLVRQEPNLLPLVAWTILQTLNLLPLLSGHKHSRSTRLIIWGWDQSISFCASVESAQGQKKGIRAGGEVRSPCYEGKKVWKCTELTFGLLQKIFIIQVADLTKQIMLINLLFFQSRRNKTFLVAWTIVKPLTFLPYFRGTSTADPLAQIVWVWDQSFFFCAFVESAQGQKRE